MFDTFSDQVFSRGKLYETLIEPRQTAVKSRILPVFDPRSEGQLSQFGVDGLGSASGWQRSLDAFRVNGSFGPFLLGLAGTNWQNTATDLIAGVSPL